MPGSQLPTSSRPLPKSAHAPEQCSVASEVSPFAPRKGAAFAERKATLPRHRTSTGRISCCSYRRNQRRSLASGDQSRLPDSKNWQVTTRPDRLKATSAAPSSPVHSFVTESRGDRKLKTNMRDPLPV